jgi:hypothetical protein
VDAHLANNLIPLQELVGEGTQTVGITDHIRANMYACESLKTRQVANRKSSTG